MVECDIQRGATPKALSKVEHVHFFEPEMAAWQNKGQGLKLGRVFSGSNSTCPTLVLRPLVNPMNCDRTQAELVMNFLC